MLECNTLILSVSHYKFVGVHHLLILHLSGLQQTLPALFHLYIGENVGLTLMKGRNGLVLTEGSALNSVCFYIYLCDG